MGQKLAVGRFERYRGTRIKTLERGLGGVYLVGKNPAMAILDTALFALFQSQGKHSADRSRSFGPSAAPG